MLAESSNTIASSGNLRPDLYLPATFRHALLVFIADQLPRWRDEPQRSTETAETILTSQLCAYLSSVAHHSAGWDCLQFRTETPDEQHRNRKIDLVPSPRGAIIWVEGRRHTEFDALLPIECKRLPTPKDARRDEREYVFSRHSSTGGIQRFKAGHHGAAHEVGAMIAYIQDGTIALWNQRVASWIMDVVRSAEPGWTTADLLQMDRDDQTSGVAVLHSLHSRAAGLRTIRLQHLWVRMG